MYDISDTPNVTYTELDSNPVWIGEGSQIPVFIGLTGTAISGDPVIQKFKTYSAAAKSTELGGIGTDPETNPLLAAVKDFFEESAKRTSEDLGVPYIYVINLGTSTLTTADPWLKAMDIAKSKRDVQVEVYVGFKSTDEKSDVISLLESVNTSILNDSEDGSPRTAYFTVAGAEDDDLIAYTDDTDPEEGEAVFIQKSRIGIIEPDYFGKTVARICTTPYYEEPGYEEFRTIPNGLFDKRTPAQELALQNAGVIFIHDERTGKDIMTRINLAVSTAFASAPDLRPNDCLFHARRNTDHLVREIYGICFNQLKRNETEVNIKHIQTDIDDIIDKELEAGNMMEGTECIVKESESNPYDLEIEGNAVPVNSTLQIKFGMYISNPKVVAVEGALTED